MILNLRSRMGVALLAALAAGCANWPDVPDVPTTSTTTTTTIPPVDEAKAMRVMWLKDSSAKWREMNLTGDKITQADYEREIEALIAAGMTAHLAYVYNERDGSFGGKTDFYVSGFAGEIDHAKVKVIRAKLEYARKRGLKIWLCPFPDNGGWPDGDMAKCKKHLDNCDFYFGDLADGWMIALEPEEYWSLSELMKISAHLRKYTQKPIGVHGTKQSYKWAQACDAATYVIYQDDVNSSPDEIVARVKRGLAKTSKPWLVWEVTRGGAVDSHRLELRRKLDALNERRIEGTP